MAFFSGKKSGRKELTPLDTKQRELAAQEAEVRRQIEKNERLVKEAPRLVEERDKRRRESLLARGGAGVNRLNAGIIPDRFELHSYATGRRGKRKSERREEQLKFFALCLILFIFLIWFSSRWM